MYTSQNTYSTLNALTSKTKNVWFVFHGIGYLSRYFIKHFECLNAQENFIVAPQAPSKYYLKNEYRYVGASWLTKESTSMEIENVMDYADAVLKAEKIPSSTNLILFGFSQGVSIVTRWVAKRKIKCAGLMLYAGSIPEELKEKDFSHLDYEGIQIRSIYGETDEYINADRLQSEKLKMQHLFKGNAEIITFQGGHELKSTLIKDLFQVVT